MNTQFTSNQVFASSCPKCGLESTAIRCYCPQCRIRMQQSERLRITLTRDDEGSFRFAKIYPQGRPNFDADNSAEVERSVLEAYELSREKACAALGELDRAADLLEEIYDRRLAEAADKAREARRAANNASRNAAKKLRRMKCQTST